MDGHSKSIMILGSIQESIEEITKELYKLSENGEPPIGQRVGVTSWRCGWKEMGLAIGYDWYVHIQ